MCCRERERERDSIWCTCVLCREKVSEWEREKGRERKRKRERRRRTERDRKREGERATGWFWKVSAMSKSRPCGAGGGSYGNACDMTQSNECNEYVFICALSHMHMCAVTRAYIWKPSWYDWFECIQWLFIHARDMTPFPVHNDFHTCHDSLLVCNTDPHSHTHSHTHTHTNTTTLPEMPASCWFRRQLDRVR